MTGAKDIARSHVMEHSLAFCANGGTLRRMKRGVVKNRFKKPFVVLVSKDGKSKRSGTWPCGHRNNPHRR